MVLRRDDWLELARKVNWAPRYVDEREMFPEELSGHPWLTHDAWRDWNEAYRTTYREYVANQREKDAAVLGVGGVLAGHHVAQEAGAAGPQIHDARGGLIATCLEPQDQHASA